VGILLHFCCLTYEDRRAGFFVRIHTLRNNAGRLESRTTDLAPAYAARLAHRLCDRYGIEDRAALMSGRIFSVNNRSL
jgi:hypothetical protein